MADVRIQSVAFGDERIEVTYIEDRDVYRDGGLMARTIVIPVRAVDDTLINEAFEAVQAIVDEYLIRQRNPEERIPARGES